jgi:hypothetical protein
MPPGRCFAHRTGATRGVLDRPRQSSGQSSCNEDEPEFADTLRCWNALPLKSSPEEGRGQVGGAGQPRSPALRGMLFDAIDECAGYIVG